jgi:hypothetical protein
MCIRCILCLKCSVCKELRDNCGTNLDQAQRQFKVNRNHSLSIPPFHKHLAAAIRPISVRSGSAWYRDRSALLRLRVFDLKTQFPPRREIGPRVGARTHTRRGGAKRSSRSEAETCADGLSWHNRPAEGES